MSQPGSAVLDRESAGSAADAETLDMADETPGMDATAPTLYSNQFTGSSDLEPESGSHSPDEAQDGQNGGGTSEGDEGSS